MNTHKINGFSLIELMVAVAIAALIAAVAIPAYNGYMASARNAEAYNNMASLRLALEEYFLENNRYIGGEYDAAGIQSLLTDGAPPLGWRPAEPNAQQQFTYVVTAGDTGSLNSSYTITATSRGINVPASTVLTMQ